MAGPAIALSFRARTLETRRLETLAGSHAVRAEPALPALALPARGVPEFRACKRCRATLGPVEARAVGTESPEAGAWGRGAPPAGPRPGPPGPQPRALTAVWAHRSRVRGHAGRESRLSVEVVFSCFEKNTYSSYSEDGGKKVASLFGLEGG